MKHFIDQLETIICYLMDRHEEVKGYNNQRTPALTQEDREQMKEILEHLDKAFIKLGDLMNKFWPGEILEESKKIDSLLEETFKDLDSGEFFHGKD